MAKNTMQEYPGQGIDAQAIEPVDEANIAAVEEARQYRSRSLDDLYPELESEQHELQVPKFVERYWPKVDRQGPRQCWTWIGAFSGDYGVLAYRNGRNLSAHRLAYILEHGSIPNGVSVLHDCGNKSCVNPTHLKVGGDRENMLDAIRHGDRACRTKLTATEWDEIRDRYFAGGITYKELAREYGVSLTTVGNIVTGRRARPKSSPGTHPTAKLSEALVMEARRRAATGESRAALAAEFGVHPFVIASAVYGRTWRALPGAIPALGAPLGEDNGASKLTAEQVLEMRSRVAGGESQGKMARVYGLDRSTVSLIINRKRWTHLPDEGKS